MIHIKNIQQVDKTLKSLCLPSDSTEEIDGTGLLLLPALIDPHVHFRTPGAEHKENWITGAQAAIAGGVTTVIDMPNNTPSCTTFEELRRKHQLIQEQLAQAEIPLRYHLYFGAERHNLHEIPKAKGHAIGIKVFMGSSTGSLLIDDKPTLNEVFRIAAEEGMLVSVHAEDESTIKKNKQAYLNTQDPASHSQIRSPDAAVIAVEKALHLSAKYGTRLCILHVSTKEELSLIKQAKTSGVPVFAEVAPHHLLLSKKDYAHWGTRVQVNPPLREKEDQEALWKALNEGTLDFIGSDHAPHTLLEKGQPFGKAPSGIPSVELLLPLLLDAVQKKRLTLETMIKATRTNIEKIFHLPSHEDLVLVDMNQLDKVEDRSLHTKCGWSPYAGRELKGWPVYTIIKGKVRCVRKKQ